MRRSTLLAGLIGLTGCFPVLAHPTRVESGLQLSTYSSLSLVSDSSSDPQRVAYSILPSFDFEASLGIRDTSRDDSMGLRLAASGGLSGYGASAYVELPRDQFGSFDVGVGIAGHHATASVWTPYVQLGRFESEDMSWFVRNGVAFAAASDSSRWSVLWIPTVGIVRHRPYRDAALFLSAVVGAQQGIERPCFFDCTDAFFRTQVMLGASVSFTLMTPYRPDRR
jgi:hypothetical protein